MPIPTLYLADIGIALNEIVNKLDQYDNDFNVTPSHGLQTRFNKLIRQIAQGKTDKELIPALRFVAFHVAMFGTPKPGDLTNEVLGIAPTEPQGNDPDPVLNWIRQIEASIATIATNLSVNPGSGGNDKDLKNLSLHHIRDSLKLISAKVTVSHYGLSNRRGRKSKLNLGAASKS